ncbi:hypothetical protein [Mycobacterium nebraskense]|nr:hypothetical protein [Mycobacterium nebraskense]
MTEIVARAADFDPSNEAAAVYDAGRMNNGRWNLTLSSTSRVAWS